MALKDLNRGYGDLPSWMEKWNCPTCDKSSKIKDWAIVFEESGLDGRKCPHCDFIASQVGHTVEMLKKDKKAMKKIKEQEDKENNGRRPRAVVEKDK